MTDMTDYVSDTLDWAQVRMVLLIQEKRSDDAIAIGSEFISWANGTDTEIYCSTVIP